MRIYSVDYKRLIVLLLLIALRRPVIFAFIRSLVRPVVMLHDAFTANRAANIYKANHTGQVCYLRGVLNDAFDSDLRRIYISDSAPLDWIMLHKKELFTVAGGEYPLTLSAADEKLSGSLIFNEGNEGVHLISRQGSVGAVGFDFAVMIPTAMRSYVDESRVISLVNFYKLASKRYTINYY